MVSRTAAPLPVWYRLLAITYSRGSGKVRDIETDRTKVERYTSRLEEWRDEEIARREQRSRTMRRERDLVARRAVSRKKRHHRTWSKTLESLANPLESLRVRLQAASRSVVERASELGVLLVDYSKPGSAHHSQHTVTHKPRYRQAHTDRYSGIIILLNSYFIVIADPPGI